jgi:hypothetical protein
MSYHYKNVNCCLRAFQGSHPAPGVSESLGNLRGINLIPLLCGSAAKVRQLARNVAHDQAPRAHSLMNSTPELMAWRRQFPLFLSPENTRGLAGAGDI